MSGLSDVNKGERGLGHYSAHSERRCLFQAMPRKYRVGQELAHVPISLKIASLSLSALLTNCCSQLVSDLRREKLKAMLFNLMWIPSTFDSFDVHSSIHCSSGGVDTYSLISRLFF